MATRRLTRRVWRVADAAAEWDLPVEAIAEVVRYCEGAQALIATEARAERRRARAKPG